ncbi:MAG: sigma-70 family RNA polymerase sigma factor, partial [Chloroflexota bacterium]
EIVIDWGDDFSEERFMDYIQYKLSLDEEGMEIDMSKPEEMHEMQMRADSLLTEAVGLLKPVEQQVIDLIYYKSLNSNEIGQRINKKPGTVRQIHSRAKTKIQKYINTHIGSDPSQGKIGFLNFILRK